MEKNSQHGLSSADIGLNKLGFGVFLYAYAVLLGACYLFAYWRPIGFNIFPFLGLHDYISAPLNRVTVLIAVPFIFAVIFFGGWRVEKYRNVAIYAGLVYVVAFSVDFYQAVSRYLSFDFSFSNEPTVLVIAAFLFVVGVVLAVYCCVTKAVITIQILAIIFTQCAVSMAAGYSDGKSVYMGAQQVHFLEDKEICEPGGVRDWVFLGTFSNQTFFLNTIDKRLCLTDQKNFRLISRKVKEGL